MKWLRSGILSIIVCLPIFVLFTFDDTYNGLQDSICHQYPSFTTACQKHQDRYKRVGLVSTEFYRHIWYYLGRSDTVTPAFIESIRMQTDTSGNADARIPKIEKKLNDLNQKFILALSISLALAGAALTLLIQDFVRRAHRPNRDKIKMSGAKPTIITPVITKNFHRVRSRPPLKKPAAKKILPLRRVAKKLPTPKAIRPSRSVR